MYYYLISTLLLCLSFNTLCFAERYIVPTFYPGQEEVMVQGASIISSTKINEVLMFQTCETLDGCKANFYFSILNDTDRSIQFYFTNLRVTDQAGRVVRVVDRRELINNKNNQKNWQMFSSALDAAEDRMEAQNAGRIDYQSTTNTSYHTHFHSRSPRGNSSGVENGIATSDTQGTIHCEALRQQALCDVELKTAIRNQSIENNFRYWEEGLNNYYFDSTTIFPGTVYAANFQVDVPSELEKELEYLVFTFDLGMETHTCCFYCGQKVKKWYHFGK